LRQTLALPVFRSKTVWPKDIWPTQRESKLLVFSWPMRLRHSQDGSTFPGYELTCFVYISCFFSQRTKWISF
jgi:hypothetical protein